MADVEPGSSAAGPQRGSPPGPGPGVGTEDGAGRTGAGKPAG